MVFAAIDLWELIDEVFQDLQILLADKGNAFYKQLMDDLVFQGDYIGLKVLFRIIVLNAIKHNKEKGCLNTKTTKWYV